MADTDDRVNEDEMHSHIADSEYKRHAEEYTKFLENYVIHTRALNKGKKILKYIFFGMIILLMVALVAIFIYSLRSTFDIIRMFPEMKNGSAEAVAGVITAVVSSFVTMLVSLLKLPEIVAQYLFNPKEDENMARIIGQIQEYDIGMYSLERKIEENMMRVAGTASEITEVPETDEYPHNPDETEAGEDSVTVSG